MARRKRVTDEQHGLRGELEALGAQVAKLGERSLAEGQEVAARELEKLRDGIESLIERASEQGALTIENVGDVVRRQPITALTAAFASGIIMATLMGRR
ncbi:MAG: hypothetical protein JNK67_15660 [Alphaproteobacteria bacterium]|nr:hypothetical protein [Alphaproteobacteria bacterium]